MSILNAITSGAGGIALSGDTSGNLVIQSAGVNVASFTSTGSVGIGTSSPQNTIGVNVALTDTKGVVLQYNGDAKGGILLNPIGGEVRMGSINTNGTYFTTLYANNTERMRVAADGTVGIGLTSGFGAQIDVSGSTSSNSCYFHNVAGTGVYLVNGNTSFNTISDERNKIIDRPITNALANLNTLRTVYGRYKVEGDEDKSRLFLIAQDVQKVYPEVIDVQENEEKTLGLRYVDLVPVLISAIQELNAKVDAQAAEIQAIKGAK